MKIQHVDSNVRFGKLRGVKCKGEFSKSDPKHMEAVGILLNSPAFEQFGEKYDYVANFYNMSSYSHWLSEDICTYKLSLTPADKNAQNKLPVKELDVVSICESSDHDAYNQFVFMLKNKSAIELNDLVSEKIAEEKKALKEKQQREDVINSVQQQAASLGIEID